MNEDYTMFKYITENIMNIIIPTNKFEQLHIICIKSNNNDLEEKIKNNLMKMIGNLALECIINDYHKKRKDNLIIGEKRKDRIENFINDYAKDTSYVISLFEEYNILREWLDRHINDYFNQYLDIIQEYQVEKKAIAKLLNRSLGNITDIVLGTGDLHDGKTVAMVSCEYGKIVYKPRKLEADSFLEGIMKYVTSILPTPISFLFPKILSYNNHSWQEFIENQECTSMYQVHNYYYRSGVFLAVFYLLSTTDIHYENIISYGEHPIIIDLETLVYGEISNENYRKDNRNINSSVLMTNMLPNTIRPNYFDINISALFTGESVSKTMVKEQLIPHEEFDWSYIKEKVVLSSTQNKLLLNGKEVEPYLVEEDVIRGFKNTLDGILRNKQELLQIIDDSDNIKIRQVLRPTYAYHKFIFACQHPDYLSSKMKQEKVLNLLIDKFEPGAHGYLRVEKEIEDLRNGYIPLFYTYFNDTALYSSNKIICSNYYFRSLKKKLKNKIDSLDANSIDYQIRFIRMSFLSLYGFDRIKTVRNSVAKKDELINVGLTKEVLNEYAYHIKNKLIQVRDDYYSIVIPYLSDNGYRMQYMGSGLYYTGGLIWFLIVYSVLYNYDYIKYPKGMLDTLIKNYEFVKTNPNEDIDYSVFQGYGGLLYLVYNFNKISPDTYYYNVSKEIINDILIYYKENQYYEKAGDYINGFASILHLICNIYLDSIKCKNSQQIIKIDDIRNLGELFLKNIKLSDYAEYGFAHGLTGICVVASALYRILSEKKYYDLIHDLEFKINQALINCKKYSWCKGKGGIILAKKIIHTNLSEDLFSIRFNDIELDKALKNNELCLCHGIYGTIDICKSVLNDREIKKYESSLYKKRFNSILDINWFQHSKYQYEAFMLGGAGVAYCLARLFYDLPSLLELEIYDQDLSGKNDRIERLECIKSSDLLEAL